MVVYRALTRRRKASRHVGRSMASTGPASSRPGSQETPVTGPSASHAPSCSSIASLSAVTSRLSTCTSSLRSRLISASATPPLSAATTTRAPLLNETPVDLVRPSGGRIVVAADKGGVADALIKRLRKLDVQVL